MLGYFVVSLVFLAGLLAGAALVTLAYERNAIGVTRRKLSPRISKLDLFELPESMRTPDEK